MDDDKLLPNFPLALAGFMKAAGHTDASLGMRLYPPVGYNGVRGWRIGKSEPSREHRRQLIKLSKGKITAKHFT